ARVRGKAGRGPAQPRSPTQPATMRGTASGAPRTTVTLAATFSNAARWRFAAQPVTKTRSAVRAARLTALRDFATASAVTQHVVTIRSGARTDSTSDCPVAHRAS